MAGLVLPRGPRELFYAVHKPLVRAFDGEENIRFGGGTALAARWAHRHSVDVDLFVEAEPYRHFQWNTGGRFNLDLTAVAPVEQLNIRHDGTEIIFAGLRGHVSIDVARGLPDDPRSSGPSVPADLSAAGPAFSFLPGHLSVTSFWFLRWEERSVSFRRLRPRQWSWDTDLQHGRGGAIDC